MNQLQTIDIKGKPYVTVNERIKYFRALYPGYRLITRFKQLDDVACVLIAEVQDQTGCIVATGVAREVNGDSFINKTSYVENCETSAWGRALANFGIGIDSSVASAEEVLNAVNNQGDRPTANGSTSSSPDEEIRKAHTQYINTNLKDIPEHFTVDYEMFKTALRKEAKKQIPKAKQKAFEWTAENMKPFWLCIPITDVLVENKDADTPG